MKNRPTSKRRRTTRSVLRLLDLEHAKAAVLNTLTSPDAQRTTWGEGLTEKAV
jgi:hypothetical protein